MNSQGLQITIYSQNWRIHWSRTSSRSSLERPRCIFFVVEPSRLLEVLRRLQHKDISRENTPSIQVQSSIRRNSTSVPSPLFSLDSYNNSFQQKSLLAQLYRPAFHSHLLERKEFLVVFMLQNKCTNQNLQFSLLREN